ncbi:SMP-30/gluconolactonase/LRE family protein [Opitutus terrae]|uniref:ATP/GTP-binding protein n=1 Tax=Opitutus terrae (strain DSM 11246 / JCM 15787 / PB90-1) TaxID=452637 RepID=B1ZY11_OPITP|nr:ATP/GTP-binding protein [Opitutus terrae]ACB75210.1 conserved hypothetical protein; predicted ATP/GTP-binding [Opitutus terrae PB90-1]
MKTHVITLLAILGAAAPISQAHELKKIWESAPAFKVPESVLHDRARQVLYVSNIEGEPWAKDGHGSIGKLGLDGQVLAAEWVTGLDAPKGMALHGARLYVGDMDALVVIDVDAGKIIERIAVPGAQGLNDVTVDEHGVVYASDSPGKKVYEVKDGHARPLLQNLKGPNGVLAHNGVLYVLDGEGLYRVADGGQLTLICDGMSGGVDGVEPVGNGDFLVSCWRGAVHYVKADGTRETLLDTQAQKIYSADIGYDPATRTVYVPTFFGNSVVAYTVK